MCMLGITIKWIACGEYSGGSLKTNLITIRLRTDEKHKNIKKKWNKKLNTNIIAFFLLFLTSRILFIYAA